MAAGAEAVRAKRGILYVKWGPNNSVLERSIRSVRAIYPEMPIYVQELEGNVSLLDKAGMMAYDEAMVAMSELNEQAGDIFAEVRAEMTQSGNGSAEPRRTRPPTRKPGSRAAEA